MLDRWHTGQVGPREGTPGQEGEGTERHLEASAHVL